jgi:hypothetical protein
VSNSKISALTSATTPLAGTEVLPIVQSGATVKVANNDLRPKQIQSSATSGILQVLGPSAGTSRVMTTPNADFTVARTDAAQSFTGDQTLSTGNLIIGTSGKGIDFSATPGTGTSELLADYEEGTWTPSVTAGSIAGTNKAYVGTYTKIGRAVTITFKAYSTSGSNDIFVGSYVGFSGLPFTSTYGGTSFTSTEDIDFKRGGEIAVGDSSAILYLGACGVVAGTNTIFGSLTYIV